MLKFSFSSHLIISINNFVFVRKNLKFCILLHKFCVPPRNKFANQCKVSLGNSRFKCFFIQIPAKQLVVNIFDLV